MGKAATALEIERLREVNELMRLKHKDKDAKLERAEAVIDAARRPAQIWRLALEDDNEMMRILDLPEDQMAFIELENALSEYDKERDGG